MRKSARLTSPDLLRRGTDRLLRIDVDVVVVDRRFRDFFQTIDLSAGISMSMRSDHQNAHEIQRCFGAGVSDED